MWLIHLSPRCCFIWNTYTKYHGAPTSSKHCNRDSSTQACWYMRVGYVTDQTFFFYFQRIPSDSVTRRPSGPVSRTDQLLTRPGWSYPCRLQTEPSESTPVDCYTFSFATDGSQNSGDNQNRGVQVYYIHWRCNCKTNFIGFVPFLWQIHKKLLFEIRSLLALFNVNWRTQIKSSHPGRHGRTSYYMKRFLLRVIGRELAIGCFW